MNLGDIESAISGYTKALEIKKNVFGKDHIEYANALGKLSRALSFRKDFQGARKGY
jgi:hypothetical protein